MDMQVVNRTLKLYPDPIVPWNADTFHGVPHYETYRRRDYVYAGVDPEVLDEWAWSSAWDRVAIEALEAIADTAPASIWAGSYLYCDEACRYDDPDPGPGPLAFWTAPHEWRYLMTDTWEPYAERSFLGAAQCGQYGADAAPYFPGFRSELQAEIDAIIEHVPLETVYDEREVDTEINFRPVNIGRQIRAEIQPVGWRPGLTSLGGLRAQVRRGETPRVYLHIETF